MSGILATVEAAQVLDEVIELLVKVVEVGLDSRPRSSWPAGVAVRRGASFVHAEESCCPLLSLPLDHFGKRDARCDCRSAHSAHGIRSSENPSGLGLRRTQSMVGKSPPKTGPLPSRICASNRHAVTRALGLSQVCVTTKASSCGRFRDDSTVGPADHHGSFRQSAPSDSVRVGEAEPNITAASQLRLSPSRTSHPVQSNAGLMTSGSRFIFLVVEQWPHQVWSGGKMCACRR